jgi:hypothetical protein
MSIKPAPQTRRGWTLVELLMASGIFSLCGLVMMGLYLFCLRGFASTYNYSVLDQYNRQAMDLLTREIRQARQVTSYTTNSISIVAANPDGTTNGVTYQFSPTSHKMLRTSTDGTSKVLLNNCTLLSFSLFQRNPVNGSYDIYPAATNNWQQTVKVIQLTWKTSLSLPNGTVNSENIQTARIVIRKQQD